MDGDGGFVADYKSLDVMAIPPNLMIRPDGDEFAIYDIGP